MKKDKKHDVSLIAATDDLKPILSELNPSDSKAVYAIRDELADNWKKKQLFRTETEMRISVLNDAKHPTNASKYWQSVREMSAMFDALIGLSFDMRRHKLTEKKLVKKMEKAIEKDDELVIEGLQIDIDEHSWSKANMKQTAEDRVRELSTWSQIKSELNDGSFDSENVDTHQAVSYLHRLENRVKALSPTSEPAEVINAAGPFETLKRLTTDDGKRLKGFDGSMPENRLSAGEKLKKLK
jgi:hypothetical protein